MFSCIYTEERIEFCHTGIKSRSMECCSDVCPSVEFSYHHIWSWSSTRVTIRLFVTTLTQALIRQLEASSKKNPGCFKLLPLRVTETTRFCDPSMKNIFSWTLPQMCGCFWALQTVLLTAGLDFCSNMHYQLLDLLRRVCLSKLYPINWICHRLTSLKV